jgi:hypothetical protein
VRRAHTIRSYGPPVTADQPNPDTRSGAPPIDLDPVQHYEIRVKGRLAPRWSAWFDGFDMEATADGTTVIRGPVVDQSALHGLLQKLRDVGIPLLSLTEIATRTANEPNAHPTQKET